MKQLRLAGQKGYVTVPQNHPCGRRYLHDRWTRTSGWGRGGGQPVGRARCYPKQLRAGADWVKILTSNRGDIPEFTQEELDAAVDEAHRQG